ncbi:ParA family protein, partial [Campylobacter sp. CH185]
IVIPRNVKLAESPSFGKPIILYDIKSPGSVAYQNLAYSILG